MMQKIFLRIVWFVLLVLLQALVFNNIHIGGYAIPMPYLYFCSPCHQRLTVVICCCGLSG